MIMFKRVTVRQARQKTVIPTYSGALTWENHLSSQEFTKFKTSFNSIDRQEVTNKKNSNERQ